MFFLPDLDAERLELAGEQAHHALGPRRLREGAELELFDGRGTIARACVASIDRRRRTLGLDVVARVRQPQPVALVLAAALPKGERVATMLDMCTQVGMTDFIPLACERSVTRAGDGAAARWQRVCVEACKQSRRAWIPRVHEPLAPAAAATRPGARVWLADPAGSAVREAGALAGGAAAGQVVLVGPEGGFTEAEVRDVLAAGASPVAFGAAVLRVETAAVVALAWCAITRASDVPVPGPAGTAPTGA